MDTLSSMANIAGYKGVLLAAEELNKYFPMLMTAAGMVFPAKVFVIGAARRRPAGHRHGAPPRAPTSSRPTCVPRSRSRSRASAPSTSASSSSRSAAAGGGYAKELSEDDKPRQRELLAEQCAAVRRRHHDGADRRRLRAAADHGRDRAPHAARARCIVDLAAEGGGNCELSRPGETVVEGGVKIIAPLNLPATMPTHASLLFSRNLTAFLLAFSKDKAFVLDLTDDIQQGAAHHPRRRRGPRCATREAIQAKGKASVDEPDIVAPPLDLPSMLFVFMLATFIGIGVIRRVSRLLHTPLMSLTNAISAIAVVGAIIVAGSRLPDAHPDPRARSRCSPR